MADISKITLPNGNTYNIKDAEARAQISALTGGDAVVFMGVSTTALTDGGSESPTVGGSTKTPAAGQLYFYGSQEFIYGTDNKWHGLGDLSSLGTLASKNKVKYDKATSVGYTSTNSTKSIDITGSSAAVSITATANNSGNYTPAGTVSQPTFSNGSISGSGKTTPTGTVSQPSFSGTGVRLVTGNIAVPTSASFTGTEATISVSGTATGTVSQPTFSGTKASGLTVSPAASGTATYTPEGTVAAPTISVATAGSTTTIKNPTSVTVAKTVVAAAPGATAPNNNLTYYSVSDETLSLYQLGYTTGASITTSNVTVKNGDAAYSASAPAFTGTGKRLVLQDYTPAGAVSQPSFSNGAISGSATYTPAGTIGLTTSNKTATVSAASSGTVTYTPGGTVSQPTFTGDEATVNITGTATGTVSQPTFSGTKVQLAGTTTASGSVTLPTLTVSHTTTEATYE